MSTTRDHHDADIRRRADGTIDLEFYANRAMTARAAAFGEARAALARWLRPGRRDDANLATKAIPPHLLR